MLAEAGGGLGDVHPGLARAAQVCVRYPTFPVARFKLHSNEYVLWTCSCGGTTKQKVQNVTKKQAVVCVDCRPAGKTRWEFEVAELLRRMLSMEVRCHFGATRKEEVDLYVPELDVAVELDPWLTHRGGTSKDVRQLAFKQVRFSRMTRFREQRLEAIQGCPVVPDGSPSLVWAERIAEWLAPDEWTQLTPEQTRDALRAGAAAWLTVQMAPPPEPLGDIAALVAEFVEDLDVPGRTPAWISRGSGDLCRWRCEAGHEYDCPVYHRTGAQRVGCRTCGAARAGLARRTPEPGHSAADRHTHLAGEFLLNLTRPKATMTQMRSRSHDRCLWRCGTCATEWVTTLHNRTAGGSTGGCRTCRQRAAWQERRIRQSGHVWEANQRARAAMESYVAHHGHCRVLPHEVWDDVPLGEWIKTWRARWRRIGQDGLHDGRDLAWLADLKGWDPRPRQTRWWAAYEAVRAAACPGETIDVALAVAADPALYHFVNKQRSYYRKGQHLDRAPLLEKLDGWSWVGPGRGKRASAALPDKRRDRAASRGESVAGRGLEGE